ncbi:sulfurtransferase complex subunit TusB [Ectothiorhodospiraceae bacterium BW-2]|nr:sulfurtransferase complex subunit TusB [Ectothiorhodospiraceae bacterium BW-2]
MLHIVNKSPFQTNALEGCLSCAEDGGAVLLYEDGVYAALANSAVAEKMKQALSRLTIYALEGDLQARGIADKVLEGIQLTDYAGFVELAVNQDKVNSWL